MKNVYSTPSVHISMAVAGIVSTVLIREVPSFQRYFCTHLYVAGTVGTVLIREVPHFRGTFVHISILLA